MSRPKVDGRKKVVVALHDVLDRDNSLSRCCAIRALAKLNARDKKSRQRLIDLLRDPDPDVRIDAAVVLGQMRVADAVVPLLGNLENDPEGDVRIEAVKALASIRSKRAVEPLIRCFKADGYPELDTVVDDLEYGPWWEVQSQALSALGEIGDQRALEPVVETLEDEDYDDLQESGFRVLARLNTNKAKAYLLKQLKGGATRARRRAAQALGMLPELRGKASDLSLEFLDALIGALVDDDASVRAYAARALGATRSPQAVVPLTLLLTDPDREVRAEVATLLGQMQGPDVLNRLHPLLAEPDQGLKRRVVRLLGDIGDPASVAPLSALLSTSDEDLLYEVVHALSKLGIPGPQQKLAEILADDKRHSRLRIAAAEALGHILAKQRADRKPKKQEKKTAPATPEQVLTDAVFDQNESVSHAALTALVEMDPKRGVRRLIALLQDRAPAKIAQRHQEPSRAPSDSSEAREESEPPARELPKELEQLLAGHSAQTSTLASMLADQGQAAQPPVKSPNQPASRAPTNPVRILAARLLGNVPNPGASAVSTLRKAFNEGETALRKETLLTLGRIGDKRGLPTVLKGLEADDHAVRLAALEALSGFSNVTGIGERLAKLCEDPDPDVRARAVQALAPGRGREVTERLCRALEDEHLVVCRAALAALSSRTYTQDCADRIANLMFRLSGELRHEAAATLRRFKDFSAVPWLMDILNDAEQEEFHWICIDALAEMYADRQANVS